jgi:hypothetical protein
MGNNQYEPNLADKIMRNAGKTKMATFTYTDKEDGKI